MPIKSKYIRKVESSTQTYSSTPSHAFNIQEMLKNKPCWETLFGEEIEKKKTLVINLSDEKTGSWTPLKKIIIVERLHQLQKEGFKIWSYTSSDIEAFNVHSMDCLKSNNRNDSEKTITETLLKKVPDLDYDDVCVLGIPEIEELMEGDDEDWTGLPDFEKIDLSEKNISVTSLAHLLTQKSDRITSLNLSGCLNLEGALLPKLPLNSLETLIIQTTVTHSPAFESLLPHRSIRKTYLDHESLKNLILSAPNLKVLRLEGMKNFEIPVECLQNMEELLVSDPLVKTYGNVLSVAKHLKVLEFSHFDAWDGTTSVIPASDQLEDISFMATKIDAASLQKLLSRARNLRRIALTACAHLNGTYSADMTYACISEITAARSGINESLLNTLLAGSRTLKYLNLSGCKAWNGKISVSFSSEHLESLYLSFSSLQTDVLYTMLLPAKKLETLSVASCKIINEDIKGELPLRSLKRFDARKTDITLVSLQRVLCQASELVSLDLKACTRLKGDIAGEFRFERLNLFDARGSSLPTPALEKLLFSAKTLENLYLSRCQNLHENLVEDLSLDSLLDLDAAKSNLTSESLGKLLARACKLTELNLYECDNLDGTVSSDLALGSLMHLNASASNINTATLGKLLQKTQALTTLHLNQCRNLMGPMTDDIDLASLQRIELCESNMGTSLLGKFLSHAKRLRSLDLRGALVADLDDFPDHLNLRSLKTLDLTDAVLPPNILKKIIAACPKNTKIIGLNKKNERKEPKSEKNIPALFFREPVWQAKTTNSLDANTDPGDTPTFHVTQIFKAPSSRMPPMISKYRRQIWNQIEINPDVCSINHAFRLFNTDDLDLELLDTLKPSSEDVYAQLDNEKEQYYGKQKILLTKEWQPLASLSPTEKLQAWHVDQNCNVHLAYSKRDNLYYVRSTSEEDVGTECHIDWTIEIPAQLPQKLPEDIDNKIEVICNFKAVKLDIKPDRPTGKDYLNALQNQETGACRHRTLVFKEWMEKAHPECPVRIIENDCHSFIEFFYNNQWISRDLGGYPGYLDILEERPQEKKEEFDTDRPELIPVDEPNLIENKKTGKSWFISHREKPVNKVAPASYLQHVLSDNDKKKLLYFKDSQSIDGFRHHLQSYCKNTSRPCFYIHSKEDLVCSASYMFRREDQSGEIKNGPGGALHDFLTRPYNQDQAPVLLINYDAFSAQDIVRFNALLDETRHADGTALPEHMKIIGMMNPERPGAYQGVEFISRFDDQPQYCPFAKEELAIPEVAISNESIKPDRVIDFYGSSLWEERLLGRWIMEVKTLRFEEGELVKALLAKEVVLELRNALWQTPDFVRFWQQAQLYGYFEIQGKRYTLPENMALTRSDGLLFDQAHKIIQCKTTTSEDAFVLNASFYSRLFGQYACDNNGHTICYQPGIIEQYKNKTVRLYLTGPLPLNLWAQLLDNCRKHRVTIALSRAPGLELPKELAIKTPTFPVKKATAFKPDLQLPHSSYIASDDLDVTLSQLQVKDALILDVSEVAPTDLLIKLTSKFDEKLLTFHFSEAPGALLNALDEDHTVILKGVINPELQEALSELLFKRMTSGKVKGRLLIISDRPHLFPGLPEFSHVVTLEEKQKALAAHSLSTEVVTSEPLCHLMAMKRYQMAHPGNKAPYAVFEGLETLPDLQRVTSLSLEDSERQKQEFNNKRMTEVQTSLTFNPFVCLAGMTGVGKTTFMYDIWKKTHPNLWVGEENLLKWATDKREGYKTLFIDEANIGGHHWSLFEGLLQEKPGLLIGNKWHTLSPEHKVVFAINPMSYGGERQMPSLFQRHGNTIVFEPLTPAYLYEELLKPVLEGFKAAKAVAMPILAVAEFISQISKGEVLVTPREFGMAALLTVSYCLKNPKANPVEVAQHYAWTLTRGFVPEASLKNFDARFKPKEPLTPAENRIPTGFTLTTSNQPAFDALNDFLNLRALRLKKQISGQGGLGGLILEGEPGIGKTELVAKTLLMHGLQKKTPQSLSKEPGFYIMPVSMPLAQKQQLLLKAFHEGSVVVVDEINSAPMMERLINSLLMGTTPEGKKADVPGFLLIGTQNPSRMAGRATAGKAQQHRSMTVHLSDYNRNEMIMILEKKGLNNETAVSIIDDYLAVRFNSTPALCFRDVLKCAKRELARLRRHDLLLNALQTGKITELVSLLQENADLPRAPIDKTALKTVLKSDSPFDEKRLMLDILIRQNAVPETKPGVVDKASGKLQQRLGLLETYLQHLDNNQAGKTQLLAFYQHLAVYCNLLQETGEQDFLKQACTAMITDFLQKNSEQLKDMPDVIVPGVSWVYSLSSIIANIALAIATLGISLIYGGISASERGHFGFFAHEESSNIDEMQPVTEFMKCMG